MAQPPQILNTKTLAKTRIFEIQEIHYRFSNGHEYFYEKIAGRHIGAVMIIPMLDEHTFLLIREFAAAAGKYVLGFPKGAIDEGEDILNTANRELMEEAGYGANKLTHLAEWSLSPAYFNAAMHIVLAKDLYPQKMQGDEPEPIEVIPWKIKDISDLLVHPEFHESRSVAAVLLLERMCK